MTPWNNIEKVQDIDNLIKCSYQKPQLIFKHSTRCSISAMALQRFERNWDVKNQEIDLNFLDLLAIRPISSHVANVFEVEHESPQVLLIINGRCIYHTSHNDISVTGITQNLAS